MAADAPLSPAPPLPSSSDALPRVSRARSAAASARQAGALNKHDAEECGALSQRSLSCQALHPADKMEACREHIASYRACTQQLRERKAAERAAQRAAAAGGGPGTAALLLAVVAACALLCGAEAAGVTVTEIKPGGSSPAGSGSGLGSGSAAASAAAAALPPSQAAAAAAARAAAKDGDKRSPLHELALGPGGGGGGSASDEEAAAAAAVRRALAADPSLKVDAKDRFGWTALHYAASEGSVGMVRALLAAGANHDALDNWGERALHKAAQRGQAAALAALLDAGANANAMDKNMRGPLIEAATEGHVECVRRLLAAGAFEGAKTTYDSTPLSAAKGAQTKALLRERADSRAAETAAESERLREAHETAMRDNPPVAQPVCEDPSGDKPQHLETVDPDMATRAIRIDADGRIVEPVPLDVDDDEEDS